MHRCYLRPEELLCAIIGRRVRTPITKTRREGEDVKMFKMNAGKDRSEGGMNEGKKERKVGW